MGKPSFHCFHHTKCLFATGFLLASVLLYAQDTKQDSTGMAQDSLETIQKPVKQIHVGFYLEAMTESVEGLNKRNFSQQFGIGVEYHFLSAGIYQNLASGHNSRLLIFPNKFDLIYTYGGTYLSFRILKSRMLESYLRFNYGNGDMVWERSDDKTDFTRDKYYVIKPELQVAFVLIPYVKLFGMVGYRRFVSLDLPSIGNNDLSGITFALGIKVGYFR